MTLHGGHPPRRPYAPLDVVPPDPPPDHPSRELGPDPAPPGGRAPAWHEQLPREELVRRLIARTEALEYANHRLDMLGIPNTTTTMGGTTSTLSAGGRIERLVELASEGGVNLGRVIECAKQDLRRRKGPKVTL